MEGAVCFAAPYVGGRDAFYVARQRFDVSDDGHLDYRMRRIVSRKLVAYFDRPRVFLGVNFDEDGSNLPRLDDFFKVKVAGLASARRGGFRGYGSDETRFIRTPDRGGDSETRCG